MLKDEIIINVESGKGGRGSLSLFQNRSYGGDGGNGGSVYLKGSKKIYDLSWFIPSDTYKAENGESGLKGNKRGPDGKDLVLSVPLTTEVYIDRELRYVIDNENEQVLILRGGIGGLGNTSLRRKHRKDTYDALPGVPRRENAKARLHLVLKLKSDIIFIGYPSAGKSSLLNALTNREVKTAAYEFTTLEPQLGMMDGLTLMDLPGLIEGAHEGKGLGTDFVKHTEYSKLIAHFVALDNTDPMKTYHALREEIHQIDENLYNKEEVVILTKSDEVDEKTAKDYEKKFQKMGIKAVSCSIIDDESLLKVKVLFKESIVKINEKIEQEKKALEEELADTASDTEVEI